MMLGGISPHTSAQLATWALRLWARWNRLEQPQLTSQTAARRGAMRGHLLGFVRVRGLPVAGCMACRYYKYTDIAAYAHMLPFSPLPPADFQLAALSSRIHTDQLQTATRKCSGDSERFGHKKKGACVPCSKGGARQATGHSDEKRYGHVSN